MNGDEDDERGDAVTRKGDTGAARCRCSGKNSTGGEATLRREPLSVPTTSGGGSRAAALRPEGLTRGNPELDGVDVCSITIGCRSRCSRAFERVIKPKMREAER
uniref:Uncharacterized protein n=1 Tax=Oryza meridionalis TaxID=40149 RepID=A0A0E0DGI4_9ORYZ